jgi:hypothetical protein
MNDYLSRRYELTKENENSKYNFIEKEDYNKPTFATFCFCLSFINIIAGIFLTIYFDMLIAFVLTFSWTFLFFSFGMIAKNQDNIDKKLDEIKLQFFEK